MFNRAIEIMLLHQTELRIQLEDNNTEMEYYPEKRWVLMRENEDLTFDINEIEVAIMALKERK